MPDVHAVAKLIPQEFRAIPHFLEVSKVAGVYGYSARKESTYWLTVCANIKISLWIRGE
jgi:hypothetical protein